MNKRKCYLAGGMQKFGKDRFDESNFWRTHIQNSVAEMPVKIFNPNDYFSFKDEPPRYASQREVMDFDHNLVRNSDFIVVNGKDLDKSIGTQIEIYTAWQLKIPVFVFGIEQDPHPWIDRCITRYEKSMNDVVEYIEDFYCS